MKKGKVILVLIAVVLAIVAISLQFSDTNEVNTSTGNAITQDTGHGKVGITIEPPVVEDKLNSETTTP